MKIHDRAVVSYPEPLAARHTITTLEMYGITVENDDGQGSAP